MEEGMQMTANIPAAVSGQSVGTEMQSQIIESGVISSAATSESVIEGHRDEADTVIAVVEERGLEGAIEWLGQDEAESENIVHEDSAQDVMMQGSSEETNDIDEENDVEGEEETLVDTKRENATEVSVQQKINELKRLELLEQLKRAVENGQVSQEMQQLLILLLFLSLINPKQEEQASLLDTIGKVISFFIRLITEPDEVGSGQTRSEGTGKSAGNIASADAIVQIMKHPEGVKAAA